MSKWKATLPKEAPEEGKTHFVIAFGKSRGSRIEYSGQIESDRMQRLLKIALAPYAEKEPK